MTIQIAEVKKTLQQISLNRVTITIIDSDDEHDYYEVSVNAWANNGQFFDFSVYDAENLTQATEIGKRYERRLKSVCESVKFTGLE